MNIYLFICSPHILHMSIIQSMPCYMLYISLNTQASVVHLAKHTILTHFTNVNSMLHVCIYVNSV